jgi:hypothetical protein
MALQVSLQRLCLSPRLSYFQKYPILATKSPKILANKGGVILIKRPFALGDMF